jgi:small subunit ribosomal protein S18
MPKGKAKTKFKKRKKKRRQGQYGRESKCRFCRAKAKSVDHKDLTTLVKLLTPQGKMFSRKRSGNCARHQRMVKVAIKRARFLAFLPFVG